MIASIDHIVLTSKDVEKTIHFYCNLLGMKLEKYFNENDSKLRIFLKFGNQKINIHQEKNLFSPHAKNPIPGSIIRPLLHLEVCTTVHTTYLCFEIQKF